MEPRELFGEAAASLETALRPGEVFLACYTGEDSDFVRLNENRVRQAGHVTQHSLWVDLIEGPRHTEATIPLSGDLARDVPRLGDLLGDLREQRTHVEDDPYLNYSTQIVHTEDVRPSSLPDPAEAVAAVMGSADDLDLVGIWASGSMYRGFANSLGQRNWFESASFNLDWSCYHQADRAVKCGYAGFDWSQEALEERLKRARVDLDVLAWAPRTIPPGAYRAYLAPRALMKLFQLLSWEAFGLKGHRTGNTPLVKMVQEDRQFGRAISLTENHAGGLTPPFTGEGFLKPETVPLIQEGCIGEALAAARSAKEFGERVNAAHEQPVSLFMAGGELPEGEILERLGTGVYINDLWYCNYSNRNECSMTGMTRFASFWVEDGRIQAPLSVMRFDDSLYRMFGDGLLGLTQTPELIVDSGSYGERSSRIMKLPGALIEDFRFAI